MRVKTVKQLARTVAERWEKFYSSPVWHPDMKTIHEKLLALGKNPTPEQVNDVIGNNSWTEPSCDECGKTVSKVIEVGEERDYESHTAELCYKCIQTAYFKIR